MASVESTGLHLIVNGEPRVLPGHGGLVDLLSALDVDVAAPRGVAVAVNDAVVRRQDWHDVHLREGDRVEVVTAKAGG